MTCYFRHIKHVFEKAEIEITNANMQEVDRIIHGIVGVKYSNCPDAWRELKKRMAENEEDFVSKLREEWKKHT